MFHSETCIFQDINQPEEGDQQQTTGQPTLNSIHKFE